MIYWLDNNENHEYAINENWGRELLELFSMGVGSYTEGDIKEAARAFTGWTITPKIPRQPYKRFPWSFEYRYDDHDEGEKIFLGERGRFNGEDIIDIIVRQPATARFISRHLYNFFVADEPQVPSWSRTPARDPEAIEVLSRAYFDHKYDFKSILRELFNSEFFKRARFARVKSPAELVAGTLRLAGAYQFPTPNDRQLAMQPIYMGQDLMNPPTVEGWHTGREWINSGTLVSRVNFVSGLLGDLSLPGVRTIISRVRAGGDLTPEELVDVCLDLMGPLDVEEATRRELIDHAQEGGDLRWAGQGEQTSAQRVNEMLQLIAGIQEYQLA